MATKTKVSGRKRKNQSIDQDASSKRRKMDSEHEQKELESTASRQELQDKYHTKFPWTFFKFWDFCVEVADGGDPLKVLECLDVSLVGPFQYLQGDLQCLSGDQLLTHYRYYFDLPEFQTILVERGCPDHSHYGFWRDDPARNPVGICKSKGGRTVLDTAGKDSLWIEPVATNLFAFTRSRIEQMGADPDRQSLSEALDSFVTKHGVKMTEMNGKSCPFKRRRKEVVCPTFHRFGLVVAVDDNEVGYRPQNYSNREMKRIFKRMHSDKVKRRKVKAEEMEIALTNVCLADDEGDPGMGYELGIAFFYSYPMFAKKAQRLLLNAYTLAVRDGFKPILKAHLKTRDSRTDPYSHLAGNSILRFTQKQKPNAKGRGAPKPKKH